eukprot:scaffold6319_cov107-Isochrysis_galbana.AAC.10
MLALCKGWRQQVSSNACSTSSGLGRHRRLPLAVRRTSALGGVWSQGVHSAIPHGLQGGAPQGYIPGSIGVAASKSRQTEQPQVH